MRSRRACPELAEGTPRMPTSPVTLQGISINTPHRWNCAAHPSTGLDYLRLGSCGAGAAPAALTLELAADPARGGYLWVRLEVGQRTVTVDAAPAGGVIPVLGGIVARDSAEAQLALLGSKMLRCQESCQPLRLCL